MYRPSAIADRLGDWELAKRDTVGGAIIAIIIVVSFLSLMSFAEFLRFQWGGAGAQQGGDGQQQQQQRGGGRRGAGNNSGNNREGARMGVPIEGEIDDIIVHHHEDEVVVDPLEPFLNQLRSSTEENIEDEDSIGEEKEEEADNNIPPDNTAAEAQQGEGHDNLQGGQEAPGNLARGVDQNQPAGHGLQRLQPVVEEVNSDDDEADSEDELEAFMRAQEEQDMEGDGPNPAPEPIPPPPAVNRPNLRPRDDARFEPQFEPLQPAFADLDAQDDGPVSQSLLCLQYLFS